MRGGLFSQEPVSEDLRWEISIVCRGGDGSFLEAGVALGSEVLVQSLVPATDYECSGRLVTQTRGGAKGIADMSPIAFKTTRKAPGAPLSLAGEGEKEEFELTWDEPPEGHIEEYEVRVEASCLNDRVPECAELCRGLNRTHRTQERRLALRLGPSLRYSFSVRARTDNPMFGPAAPALELVSPDTPRPPEVTKVVAGDGNSLALQFSPPCPPPPEEEVIYSPRFKCNGCAGSTL